MENNVLVERGAITRVGMFPTTETDDVGKAVVVESADEKGIPNFEYANFVKLLSSKSATELGSIYFDFKNKIMYVYGGEDGWFTVELTEPT